MGAYKPPSMTNETFKNGMSPVLDRISEKYENHVIMGDLNFDMLDKSKCETVSDICDIFDLSNMIKEPTCYTANNKSTLLDVILTNNTSCMGKILNFNCGLSDVHNLIACQLKIDIPSNKSKWSHYRSFKKFNVDDFNLELQDKLTGIKFSEGNDVNENYQKFSRTLIETVNKHAPLETEKDLIKTCPFYEQVIKTSYI